MVFIGFTDHSWPKLDEEGRRLQSRARGVFAELMELVHALLIELPKDGLKEIREAEKTVSSVIEREGTYTKTAERAFEAAGDAVDLIVRRIEDLYDGSGGSPIHVPDTNALIFNPDLDLWTFGADEFTLVLTPTVLNELDELKVRSRPDLAGKVESVITRIKAAKIAVAATSVTA